MVVQCVISVHTIVYKFEMERSKFLRHFFLSVADMEMKIYMCMLRFNSIHFMFFCKFEKYGNI